jgi:putative peptidoglycan lipid II flippase
VITGRLASNLRIVSLCTIASRVLGMVRDAVMAATFGNGPLLDAFSVAFRLPNLARVLLGEGVLATALLPAIVADLDQKGTLEARRTATALCVFLAGFLIVIVAGLELAATGLLTIISPESELSRLVFLTMLMLPYVVLICVSAQLSAVLHALHHFVIPALVPIVLNAVWLGVLWLVVPSIADPEQKLMVICGGVLIGGCFQLLLPLPMLHYLKFTYASGWGGAIPRVRGIVAGVFPVLLGLLVTQINTTIDSLLAWGLAAPAGAGPDSGWPIASGTASALYLGQRLYQFPLGVFGVSLGTVLYPLFTRHAQSQDFAGLRRDVALGVRLVLAIGIPASVGLFWVAGPLTTLIFERGQFTSEDSFETARIIQAYGLGVWAFCGLIVVQRALYALEERWIPTRIGIASVVANLVLNMILIWPLGGIGLAISTSLIGSIQFLLTLLAIEAFTGKLPWGELGLTLLKTGIATMGLIAGCWIGTALKNTISAGESRLLALGLPMGLGIVAYLLAAWLIGLKEPFLMMARRSTSETSHGENESQSIT